jgi:hypothetical protein
MSDDSGKTNELNLSALENEYSVVGEVRGAGGRRTFLANRRSDGAEVLIAIFSSEGAAENNALSHYAADTKMLTGVRHAGVIQPIEGRWLGTDAFAVVSERPKGTTLRQVLSTEERLSCSRIASLLQEVNGILSWAREEGVVHRGVALDGIFIAPMTERLQVSLLPTPISPDRVPDALADSTTIGKLAAVLLAGRSLDGVDAKESLASLRPDLARRVVDAVERMRSAPGDVVQPEVPDFLATIATADVLRDAELELDKQRAEYAELLRVHRETAEAERTACDRRAADLQEKLAGDRREFERQSERERAQLASERAQLTAESEQLAYQAGRLQQRRTSDHAPYVAPEYSPDLTWPDVDRRAHRHRLLGPTLVAAALIVASLVVHFEQRRETVSGVVAVGADTLIPTPPHMDARRLPRGGFLSQTAAGSVALQPKASVSPTSKSSIVATVDSTALRANESSGDTTVRVDTAADRRARLARLARLAKRDSALRADSTIRRDSLGFLRPDTLPRQ